MTANATNDLKTQVALATRLLHHYGLATYQGHVSARVPGTNTMVIRCTPDVSLSIATSENMMVMDFEGTILSAPASHQGPVPSWRLHSAVYEARSEIMAVVHTHQKWCTVFGIAGQDVLPVLHPPTASVAADPWPVFADGSGPVDTDEKAHLIAKCLGASVACHLQNHGMLFVGTTVSKAVLAAADAEQQAEITWRAMLAGTVTPIPLEFLEEDVAKRFAPPRPDVRDGVARGEWNNQEWLDEHTDAAWHRQTRK